MRFERASSRVRDAGAALADSMFEGVIFVGGGIAELGNDAVVADATSSRRTLRALTLEAAAITGIPLVGTQWVPGRSAPAHRPEPPPEPRSERAGTRSRGRKRAPDARSSRRSG